MFPGNPSPPSGSASRLGDAMKSALVGFLCVVTGLAVLAEMVVIMTVVLVVSNVVGK